MKVGIIVRQGVFLILDREQVNQTVAQAVVEPFRVVTPLWEVLVHEIYVDFLHISLRTFPPPEPG